MVKLTIQTFFPQLGRWAKPAQIDFSIFKVDMKNFFTKKGIRKFFLRWMVVNVVYLLIKASIDHDGKGMGSFLEPTPIFYYVTAFLFFMISWEYNDYLIYKQLKKGGLTLKNSLLI